MRLRGIVVAVASLAATAVPVLSVVSALATPATTPARSAVPAAEALQAVPAPAGPRAHAAPAGWNGRCHTNWHTSRAVNMWCDGTGPERYGVSAVCTKGRHTYQYDSSAHPWFGDRRGATVRCRKGTLTTWWGYPAN